MIDRSAQNDMLEARHWAPASCSAGGHGSSGLLFSIVIPTRNRGPQLAMCLEHIGHLDFPVEHFEVIVVDDGGEVDLSDTVGGFGRHYRISLVRQEHQGPAAARNTGAQRAGGRFLIFTDDDCFPTPNVLGALAKHFEAEPDRLIGGRTVNALATNMFSTASQMLLEYLYWYFGSRESKLAFFASNNMAMPTSLFRALGGFDSNFPLAAAEDRDLCDRWLQANHTMTFADDVVSFHAHPLTAVGFWNLHFRYGRGAFLYHGARKRRGQGAVHAEPLGFYLSMLRYPFRTQPVWRACELSASLLVSQVAHSVGFFWELQRSRYSSMLRAVRRVTAADHN